MYTHMRYAHVHTVRSEGYTATGIALAVLERLVPLHVGWERSRLPRNEARLHRVAKAANYRRCFVPLAVPSSRNGSYLAYHQFSATRNVLSAKRARTNN